MYVGVAVLCHSLDVISQMAIRLNLSYFWVTQTLYKLSSPRVQSGVPPKFDSVSSFLRYLPNFI